MLLRMLSIHPRGSIESGWTSDREANLKSHEYIVVLDLDETLLRHFAGKNAYEQFSPQGYEGLPKIVVDNQVSPTNIDSSVVFRKGYREFLQKLRKDPNCRGVAVFTAKADLSAIDLKNKWNVVFDGYFTRNFLELDVEGNLKEPSKDLRIFDQDLQNVVLVDDNPKRVYQRDNLIVPTQFKPEQNSGTEVGILDQIADEIIYAGSCARQKSVSFAAALKPYTFNSRGVVQGWVSNTVCQ